MLGGYILPKADDSLSGSRDTENRSCKRIARLKEFHRVRSMSDADPSMVTVLLNGFPVLRAMVRFYRPYEHGFLKNSPEAFFHVMRTSGLRPDQLLLIDDKPDNCNACCRAGIDSILFTG